MSAFSAPAFSKTVGRVALPTIPLTSCVSLIFLISSEDWSIIVTECPWADSCLLIEKPLHGSAYNYIHPN